MNEEMRELVEALGSVLATQCGTTEDGFVSSKGKDSLAKGLRMLAKYGRFRIEEGVGAHVFGDFR